MSRREFFELWQKFSKQAGRNRQLCTHFKDTLGRSLTSEQENILLKEISKTSKVFERKWKKSFRKKSQFVGENESWLDENAFQLSFSGIPQENFFLAGPSLSQVGRRKLDTLANASKK